MVTLFKWTGDKLNPVKCLQEFKSSMKFRNCDSNPGKVKLYESVRKSLVEIYEDEPEAFGFDLFSPHFRLSLLTFIKFYIYSS